MAIKIVQIVPYDPTALSNGGVILFVERLIKSLLDNKIKVKLLGISYNAYDKERTGRTDIKYEFIPLCRVKTKKFAAYKYDMSLNFKGRSLIEEDSIIHAHKVEHLWPFLRMKNPKVLTVHINYFKEVFFRKNWIIAKAYTLVEKCVLSNAQRHNIRRIIFVDRPTMEDYVKRYPGLREISEVMPVGIDLSKFREARGCRRELRIPKDDKIVLSVGRLVKEKDLSLAIAAYKKISTPKTHMLIIGDGEDKGRLMKLASDDKSIRFFGLIENKKIPSIMKSSDLFVMSSLYEGTPTTILESFAAGTPVVATDAGGIKDVVKNRYNGEVVQRDVNAFAAGIRKYLHKDLRKNCLKSAEEYSIDKISRRYIEIYREAFIEKE